MNLSLPEQQIGLLLAHGLDFAVTGWMLMRYNSQNGQNAQYFLLLSAEPLKARGPRPWLSWPMC